MDDKTLWELIRERYGDDAIIVHTPSNLDFPITDSLNSPYVTKQIIRELNGRMQIQ
jgi:hypothetical protein